LSEPVKLAKLGPRHREVLSLVAQGLGRSEIGAIVGYEPEYISWLVRQDVCQAYLAEMNAVVEFRLQSMTEQSVDTINDVMKNGASDERLKAAKLQLEATGRIGADAVFGRPASGGPDRLQQLAERLVVLLRKGGPAAGGVVSDVIDVESHEVS